PLKLIIHPLRPNIPIYLAAIGPKNVALAAEIADGWLPIFFSPERMNIYREWLDEGFATAGSGKALNDFDIAPTVIVKLGDDVNACRDEIKPLLALYLGGMGARAKNFYFNLACRYGYEEAAYKIQDLYLAGRKMEAAQTVPDRLVDEVALCGPRERIAERLNSWRGCGATTMICSLTDLAALRTMAELVL
ncbi:MAG: LLM class flavin-dependent oxidoreductase, partial [Blastocatellia bacterium]|nr:LLM class flavin-dependent oxidoreductase [Blastocatellia bacterium]